MTEVSIGIGQVKIPQGLLFSTKTQPFFLKKGSSYCYKSFVSFQSSKMLILKFFACVLMAFLEEQISGFPYFALLVSFTWCLDEQQILSSMYCTLSIFPL